MKVKESTVKQIEHARKIIGELDCREYCKKIVEASKRESAVNDYKQYQLISAINIYLKNNVPVYPTVEGAIVLIQHIIHTKSYYQFCENLVGRYLHYDPDMNMKAEEHALDNAKYLDETYLDEKMRFSDCYVKHHPIHHRWTNI